MNSAVRMLRRCIDRVQFKRYTASIYQIVPFTFFSGRYFEITKTHVSILTNGSHAFISLITLAYNVKTKDEVNEIIEIARKAGAAIVKEPQDVFWGGYHAYFSDSDGYYWEVAWGPMLNYDEQGMLVL